MPGDLVLLGYRLGRNSLPQAEGRVYPVPVLTLLSFPPIVRLEP